MAVFHASAAPRARGGPDGPLARRVAGPLLLLPLQLLLLLLLLSATAALEVSWTHPPGHTDVMSHFGIGVSLGDVGYMAGGADPSNQAILRAVSVRVYPDEHGPLVAYEAVGSDLPAYAAAAGGKHTAPTAHSAENCRNPFQLHVKHRGEEWDTLLPLPHCTPSRCPQRPGFSAPLPPLTACAPCWRGGPGRGAAAPVLLPTPPPGLKTLSPLPETTTFQWHLGHVFTVCHPLLPKCTHFPPLSQKTAPKTAEITACGRFWCRRALVGCGQRSPKRGHGAICCIPAVVSAIYRVFSEGILY